MKNQGPSLRKSIVQVLCVLLLLQGYPVLALQEAGFTVTPEPSPVGGWVEHWLDQARRPLGRWRAAWSREWEPAWASLSAAGDELAWEWEVASWAMAGAFGLSGRGGGGGSSQPPVPEKPSYKAGERPEPVAFELAPELVAGKSALQEILLVPGWNLVSLPKAREATDPATVLESIAGGYTHVLSHDACDATDPWKLYDPENPAESDLASIDPTTGLWIEATLPVDLLPEGELPPEATFSLCTGWNLVGFPAGQARPVRNALQSIEGKYVRVMAYESYDAKDPWKIYDVEAPGWANDLAELRPGRAYWILATEDAELTISNDGAAPSVSLEAPEDLAVITAPTDVLGTAESPVLEEWTLSYRAIGEGHWVEFGSGVVSIVSGKLGVFDPTLLLNGLYEIRLTASDYLGRTVEAEPIAVSVEGNMKIGHFTLSFVDLAIPVSGLDIEVLRTYDSRQRLAKGDFGKGWTLDIRQGSYRNNRPPGDGWQLTKGFLPCDSTLESKSHLTTVRLSDREIYRFALQVVDGKPSTGGGCYARAKFDYVDGPIPGATLKILGNDQLFQETQSSDRVFDVDTLTTFEPRQVRLTTRDGRIFDLDLGVGVTRVEDANGNQLEIRADGIFHSAGKSIVFDRDSDGRITRITDPTGHGFDYAYAETGDLTKTTNALGHQTVFSYDTDHRLIEVINPLGTRAVRSDYSPDGRLVKVTDALGKEVRLDHHLNARSEVISNRLGFARIFEYDTRGNVVRETDELGKVTTRSYDGKDRLLRETDSLGNTTLYSYATNGDLVSVTDPLGNSTTFAYDHRGNPTTINDPRSKATIHTYDDSNNLIRIEDPTGSISAFTYDSRGNLKEQIAPTGSVTRFDYDAFGNLIRVVDALGNETTAVYDHLGNVISKTESRTQPDGRVVELTLELTVDALSRVTAMTLPDGSTIRKTYDPLGAVLSTMDSLGRLTQFVYDAAGRQSEVILPDGSKELQAYDAEGRLVAHTDRAGRVTKLTYDAAGQLVRTTFPDDTKVSSDYDDAGRLIVSTDARGSTIAYSYDAAGRRTQMVDALGQPVLFSYDANGNQSSVTDALGRQTNFTYDDAGHLIQAKRPDGSSTWSEYDSAGRQTVAIDQAGRRTEFTYDPMGRLVQVSNPADGTTRYTYDEQGNRISQTDANGHTTRFTYDNVGRKTSRTLPDGATETFEYDAGGNLIRHADFRGVSTAFAYDLNDRLISRTHADGTVSLFTYTVAGQLATATDARGVSQYEYDSRDRLISVKSPEGWELKYSWDATSNKTAVTAELGDRGSHSTAYTYDAAGRLATVADARGGVYTYEYDAAGQRSSLSYPNGVVTSYSYDMLGRLVKLHSQGDDGVVVQSYSYALDAIGNRRSVTEHDGTLRTWEYDSLDRLVRERMLQSDGKLFYESSFEYDAVGNRRKQVSTDSQGIAATITYTYDARDRLLREARSDGSELTYGWDANGRLISKSSQEGVTSYAWDVENRLTMVRLPGGKTVRMSYDFRGARTSTTVTAENGITDAMTRFVTDTSGPLSQVLAEVSDSGLDVVYAHGDQLLGLLREKEPRYTHADHIGSIRALTNETGVVSDRYTYSGFGQLIERSGNDTNRYLFAGEAFASTIGFYYLRARWMDPATGRFSRVDPFPGFLDDPSTMHPYAYGSANPIANVDPAGLTSISDQVSALKANLTLGKIAISVGLGALTGGLDAFFQGESLEGIGIAALGGAVGGLVGAPLMLLGLQFKLVKPLLMALGIGLSIFSLVDAFANDNYSLLAFRTAMLLSPFVFLSAVNRLNPTFWMKITGRNVWVSPKGLRYGVGYNDEHRIIHVLNHTVEDLSKDSHGVFTVGRRNVLPLIDEAWEKILRDPARYLVSSTGNRKRFQIPMGREIGHSGGAEAMATYSHSRFKDLFLVVQDEINVITAFPVAP